MRSKTRITEIESVDLFLQEEKHLSGPPPEFGATVFHRHGRYETAAIWPVADRHGIVTSGQIRFVLRDHVERSVSLIFAGQAITRLDLVAPDICEPNPDWARSFGLPGIVCGHHCHSWDHNRDHVLSQPTWDLPCREPLPPQVRRFDQAWPWLAQKINLVLTREQREFELPADLLG